MNLWHFHATIPMFKWCVDAVAKSCLQIFQKLLSEDSDVDPPCDGHVEKLVLFFKFSRSNHVLLMPSKLINSYYIEIVGGVAQW